MKPFIEIYGYYRKDGDYVSFNIDLTNVKEYYWIAFGDTEPPKDEDSYTEGLTDPENAWNVMAEPKKFGVTNVYADAEDAVWLNGKGVKTKKNRLGNSAFVDIPRESWDNLWKIMGR